MTAGSIQNQAINALFGGFFGMFDVNHIMEHHTAIAMRRFNDEFRRAQRGDDDRHFVLRRFPYRSASGHLRRGKSD